MKLPELNIDNLKARFPIIQGGMGIGVSGANLAGNVAKEGGIGVISAVHVGHKEPDFEKNSKQANLRALASEIDKAREISEGGVLAINILTVVRDYCDLVKTAVDKGIDIIISGAGIPKELPKLVENSKTKIVPIVSSLKSFTVTAKYWIQKYNYVPDMVIVEGPEAGGHLGFKEDELENNTASKLEDIVVEVKAYARQLEEEYKKKIPVIAAGGIFTGKDIAKFIKLGADGVQMATRFVATEECDAHENYKQAYINAKEEDLQIIKSPVGLPGRAINNTFLEGCKGKLQRISGCYNCIKTCNPAETPYCISKALLNAVRGKTEDALLFCGSNVARVDKIVKVKDLMHELVEEATAALALENA